MSFLFFENQHSQRHQKTIFSNITKDATQKIFTKFVIGGKCPLRKLVPNFAIAKA
jgi:hypothetical protein